MITREIKAVGIFNYMRAMWAAEAEGWAVGEFIVKAVGDEAHYTSTATKKEETNV